MYVYSGKCRQCETGIETGKKDIGDNKLFTGDIVVVFKEDESGINYPPSGLTVIVNDDWKSFTDGTHERIATNSTPFAMGIKDVGLEDDYWSVMKVKDHSDVVEGEHWKDYGFNYSEE